VAGSGPSEHLVARTELGHVLADRLDLSGEVGGQDGRFPRFAQPVDQAQAVGQAAHEVPVGRIDRDSENLWVPRISSGQVRMAGVVLWAGIGLWPMLVRQMSTVRRRYGGRWLAVLRRLAYLGVTNTFAMLRLLALTDRDKDAEILALRHQITVLQRHLGRDRVRFTPADRALLAALLHALPARVLGRMRLPMRPDTVLRWHRDVLARRHATASRPKRRSRPPTVRSIRLLALRLARENPGWGYRRIHGELPVLGVAMAASTVWKILHEAGIGPADQRGTDTWAVFLRSQAEALLACDFFGCDSYRNRSLIRHRSGGLTYADVIDSAGSSMNINMPPEQGG